MMRKLKITEMGRMSVEQFHEAEKMPLVVVLERGSTAVHFLLVQICQHCPESVVVQLADVQFQQMVEHTIFNQQHNSLDINLEKVRMVHQQLDTIILRLVAVVDGSVVMPGI